MGTGVAAVALAVSALSAGAGPASAGSVPDAPVMSMSNTTDEKGVSTSYWTPPVSDGGSPLTGYLIEYSKYRDFRTTEQVTAAPDATSVELTDLAFSTFYYVHMKAVNALGQSPWSVTVYTSGLFAPSQVFVDSVQDSYRSVEIHFNGGWPTTFVAHPGGRTCTSKSYQSICILTGLDPGRLYRVTATATNIVGTSAPTTFSAISVGNATGVRKLHASVKKVKDGRATVTLTWEEPRSLAYGRLAGFEYDINDEGWYTPPSIHPWKKSVKIKNLNRGRTYKFRVAALTNAPGETFDITGKRVTITVKVP